MKKKTPSQESKLKKGRGTGHGIAYDPFLTVREVPSLGLAHRVLGMTTQRIHHLLSLLEFNLFLILDWIESVVDIREQFPLPLPDTIEISHRLNIKHPVHPVDKYPVVMTTDFLVDVFQDGRVVEKAISAKYSADLMRPRVVEKLEIERTYWEERGRPWQVVTELQIPKALVENLKWIRDAGDPKDAPGLDESEIRDVGDTVIAVMRTKPDLALRKAATETDRILGLQRGATLWVVRHLIASKRLIVDMNVAIIPDRPLVMLDKQLPSSANRIES